MSVNFARVIFSKDKVKKIVPIEFIKASKKKNSFYDPQHILDYDEKKMYYVKWFSCGNQGSTCQLNHSHPYEYYAAFIDCLSGKLSILNTIEICWNIHIFQQMSCFVDLSKNNTNLYLACTNKKRGKVSWTEKRKVTEKDFLQRD